MGVRGVWANEVGLDVPLVGESDVVWAPKVEAALRIAESSIFSSLTDSGSRWMDGELEKNN
jgi:hypothetical protein